MEQDHKAIAIPEKVHQSYSKFFHTLRAGSLKARVVNNAVKVLKPITKIVKKVAPVTAIIISSAVVANASPADRSRVAAKETGSFFGGMVAGAGAGVAASWYSVNPWVVGGSILAGSVVGGIFGEKTAEAIFDKKEKTYSYPTTSVER